MKKGTPVKLPRLGTYPHIISQWLYVKGFPQITYTAGYSIPEWARL
jgi:hypothetical protein